MQPASWKPAAGLALRIQLPPDEPNWSLPSTERSATPMSTTSDNRGYTGDASVRSP